MSFINIDDLNVYYEKSGTKGRKVLLLHGWGQNTSMMAYIGEHLKKKFIVYNIDFPGFGQSDEPKKPWGVNEYKELIRNFCIKKKIDNPIIIGHSFGCRVALKYAHDYDVYKMVLTGAAGIRPKRGVDYYIKVYSYKLMKKILSLKFLNKYKDKLEKNAGSSDYQNTSGIMRASFVKIVNEDLRPILKDIDTDLTSKGWKEINMLMGNKLFVNISISEEVIEKTKDMKGPGILFRSWKKIVLDIIKNNKNNI